MVYFFYKIANERKRSNTITQLMVEGEKINDEKLIRGHEDSHFKDLFGQSVFQRLNMEPDFWPGKFNLSDISVQFSQEEIKKAIWVLNLDKSPGPDGFSILFYRVLWDTIKGEFVNLFEEIYQFKVKLERLNYSQAILIPKEGSPQTVDQYRPIALLNGSFKIVSKVLANRLSSHMNEIIFEPKEEAQLMVLLQPKRLFTTTKKWV